MHTELSSGVQLKFLFDDDIDPLGHEHHLPTFRRVHGRQPGSNYRFPLIYPTCLTERSPGRLIVVLLIVIAVCFCRASSAVVDGLHTYFRRSPFLASIQRNRILYLHSFPASVRQLSFHSVPSSSVRYARFGCACFIQFFPLLLPNSSQQRFSLNVGPSFPVGLMYI